MFSVLRFTLVARLRRGAAFSILPALFILGPSVLLSGHATKSDIVLLGIAGSILFVLAFEFVAFIAALQGTHEKHGYAKWRTVLRHYFILGFTVPFLLHVGRERERYVRKMKAYIKRPDLLYLSTRYSRLMKRGYVAEAAYWIVGHEEIQELDAEANSVMHPSHRRLERLKKAVDKSERTSAIQSASALPAAPTTVDASHLVARLRDEVAGLPWKKRHKAEELIKEIERLVPYTRPFRMRVRELEKLIAAPREIAAAPSALPQGVSQPKAAPSEESEGLPRNFAWQREKGTITYRPSFLRAFDEMSPVDHRRIVRQLRVFSSEGSRYPSFKTRLWIDKNLPYSPAPCSVSRMSKEVRVSWTKDGSEVTFHYVWTKSVGFRGHHATKG